MIGDVSLSSAAAINDDNSAGTVITADVLTATAVGGMTLDTANATSICSPELPAILTSMRQMRSLSQTSPRLTDQSPSMQAERLASPASSPPQTPTPTTSHSQQRPVTSQSTRSPLEQLGTSACRPLPLSTTMDQRAPSSRQTSSPQRRPEPSHSTLQQTVSTSPHQPPAISTSTRQMPSLLRISPRQTDQSLSMPAEQSSPPASSHPLTQMQTTFHSPRHPVTLQSTRSTLEQLGTSVCRPLLEPSSKTHPSRRFYLLVSQRAWRKRRNFEFRQ